MKKSIYILLAAVAFVFSAYTSHAQSDSIVEGKKFSYDGGIHYNFPKDVDNQQFSGAGLHFMPKYNFSKNNFVGINLQYSNMYDGSSDYQKSFSIMPSYQYFLNNTTLTPFAGVRAGIHFISDDVGTKLAATPSLGLSFNRFYDISMEYSMIQDYGNLLTAKFTLSFGNSKTILARTDRFAEDVEE